jgi:hypothetical protein
MDLSDNDERLVAWAARTLDEPTVTTLVSWLERVRTAADGDRAPACVVRDACDRCGLYGQ